MAAVDHRLASRPPAGAAARVSLAHIGRESVWLQLLTVYALLLMLQLPALVAPDSWLAFVAGREIAAHGLPHQDHLTAWSLGRSWIDQQWLGQLVLYGLARLGGLRLALAGDVAVLTLGFGLMLAAARRLGASARSVAAAGAVVLVAAAPSTALRTETLAYPLFAGVVWLVIDDVRSPTRRIFLVLPLLVLWANLHGSVLLGAALVALRALDRLARRGIRRAEIGEAAMLAAGAAAAVMVAPYGPEALLAYYRSTLGNAAFPRLLTEWGPSSLTGQWRFYVLVAVVAICSTIAFRAGVGLRRYEIVASALLVAAAVHANRNIVWFALFSGIVLPRSIDVLWRREDAPPPVRLTRAVWAVLAAVVLAVGVRDLVHPAAWYAQGYPSAAVADPLRRAAETDSTMRVLATDRLGDWLLWTIPQLRGRVAYDTRFELLDPRKLDELAQLVDAGPRWPAVFAGYRYALLERRKYAPIRYGLLARGARVVRDDAGVTLLALRRAQNHPLVERPSSGQQSW